MNNQNENDSSHGSQPGSSQGSQHAYSQGSQRNDQRLQTHSKDAGAPEQHADSESIKDKAIGVTEAVGDMVSNAVSTGIEAGSKISKEGQQQLQDQVKQRPIEALLLAGAVGLILGVALSR